MRAGNCESNTMMRWLLHEGQAFENQFLSQLSAKWSAIFQVIRRKCSIRQRTHHLSDDQLAVIRWTSFFLLRFISFYFSRVGTYNRWGKCIRGIARTCRKKMKELDGRIYKGPMLCAGGHGKGGCQVKKCHSVLYLTNKFPIMREVVVKSRLQDTEYTLYILSKAKICVGPCILLNMKAQMSICCLQTFQL